MAIRDTIDEQKVHELLGRVVGDLGGMLTSSLVFIGDRLGLALSRHFCRLMGGDLTVESVYGHGSTFTVTLPAAVSEAAR